MDLGTGSFLSPTDQTFTYRKSTPHTFLDSITWPFHQLLKNLYPMHLDVVFHLSEEVTGIVRNY